MKNIFLPLVAVLFCFIAKAQVNCGSNIFPCSGNVGIGNSSPGFKLDVMDIMRIKGAASQNANMIMQADNGDGNAFWLTGTSAILKIGGVGSSEPSSGAINIVASGEVGIGTASPAYKLHVSGTHRVSSYSYLGTAYEPQLYLASSGSNYGLIQNHDAGMWSLGYNTSLGTSLGTSVLTWNATGRVGIGTTNPNSKLHVANSNDGMEFIPGTTNQLLSYNRGGSPDYVDFLLRAKDLYFETNGSQKMKIATTGRVDITTEDANTTLGSAAAALRIQNKSNVSAAFNEKAELQFQADGSQVNAVIAASYSSYDGTNGTGAHMIFGTKNSTDVAVQERMRLTQNGVLMIGGGYTNTYNSRYKLLVEGTIGANEVYVTLTRPWPDYVFGNNYKLLSLKELDAFIQKNKHLPNMPSAAEIKKEGGVNLGDMNAKLLEKVEELSLYIIQLEKRISSLEQNHQ